MSEESPALSVVPFSPRKPEPRSADPRDQIIRNQAKLAQLADKQFEHWEFWGQHMATMVRLAFLLAEAQRWDELHEYLKTVANQAEQMAASKTRTASTLPDHLKG